MAYKLMKRIISRGDFDKESTLDKLDAFLAGNRITPEEYQELTEMIGNE